MGRGPALDDAVTASRAPAALPPGVGMRAGLGGLLEHPLVYRLWQWPFAAAKFRPVVRHNDLAAARRVLDIGCGPGTNAAWFADATYVGIDSNPAYVAWARARYRGEFVVADARTYEPPHGARFDFILVNSLMHHLDDEECRVLLARLGTLLDDGGHVHVLELETAGRADVAHVLARLDRGTYARPREVWMRLFTDAFAPVASEPYAVSLAGVTLWNMIYLKGRRREGASA